jgi:hypothetical protein
LLGDNRDNFFPKLDGDLKLSSFSDFAIKYIEHMGFKAHICSSENEARELSAELISKNMWPCYFFDSDTTGEKDVEVFFTSDEKLDLEKFSNLGIIKNKANLDLVSLRNFMGEIESMRSSCMNWDKERLVELFRMLMPEFRHEELNKNLDQKM